MYFDHIPPIFLFYSFLPLTEFLLYLNSFASNSVFFMCLLHLIRAACTSRGEELFT